MNKPFETYPGGKSADGVYQAIINEITPHTIYIELFLGNGTILTTKKPAEFSLAFEKSPKIFTKWQNVSLPTSTQIYLTDSIVWLENFWMLASLLKNLGYTIFLFADPPYLKETRKSKRNIYENELSVGDHIRLLYALIRVSPFCNILVTHYENRLYNQMLAGWRTVQFNGQTRAGRVIDTMYMNYPEPKELHDYNFLGSDFKSRERVRGIVTRNTDKFKRMPDLERLALIENLKNENLV